MRRQRQSRSVSLVRTSFCSATGAARPGCSIRAASTGAPRCIMASAKMTASAAVTMAGNLRSTAPASTSRASRRGKPIRNRCGSPGILCRSNTARSGPIWDHPSASRSCRNTTSSRSWRRTTISTLPIWALHFTMQLATALGKCARSVPCPLAAYRVQRLPAVG